MAKQVKKADSSVTGQPAWKFKIKGEQYLVFTKDDDLKVMHNEEVVFDKFKSDLSYIEWIKTINR